MTGKPSMKSLVLTIGTGNLDRVEDSLLVPLQKSISDREWRTVILLPSQRTSEHAETIVARFPALDIRIHPLEFDGAENDPDSCFDAFDRVFEGLLDEGIEPQNMIVDFTRGTKAMSAALVLAAVRREVPVLRYLSGERDARGMVQAGSERINEVRTTMATASRRLDLARQLMCRGDFAAVIALLPRPGSQWADLWPPSLVEVAGRVEPLARFYAAWDRLDYAEAAKISDLPIEADLLAEWRPLVAGDETREWVKGLANPPGRDDHPAMAEYLRGLAADLVENGRRRIRDHQLEDALLRAYRVLELMGQARLFHHGLDSEFLTVSNAAVSKFQNDLKRKGNRLEENRDGTLKVPRERGARLLTRLEDPLGKELFDLGKTGSDIGANLRNHSILAHGFEAKAPAKDGLEKQFNLLETLLQKDDASAGRRIAVARRLDLTVL